VSDLLSLGLRTGDRVRYRRASGGHWQHGTVVGLESDGSVAVRDAKGAARSLAATRLDVKVTGARGASGWEPVAERAARCEQLRLL
jgi:hypothetical protein